MNDGWPYNVIGNLRLLHASHMQWRKKQFLTQNIELEVIFRFSCGEERMQMAELVLELCRSEAGLEIICSIYLFLR